MKVIPVSHTVVERPNLVLSHFRANGSVDSLKVGVGPFDEPEGECEKWDRITVNSLSFLR